ncbi:MAG: GNAT family N-acetyltransferase [Desulfomonilaceae bacterium]|nr:GNAT family N-acetyltransferase [Desulfomonilaceae bacterium]
MQFRLFFEHKGSGFRTLLLLEFLYEEETDWYEVRVFRGEEIIGYVHGYANRGWTPQVNNIWVAETYRRQGIGSFMMSKIEEYFGQIPLPATPIEDNTAARGFWKLYMSGSRVRNNEDEPLK